MLIYPYRETAGFMSSKWYFMVCLISCDKA